MEVSSEIEHIMGMLSVQGKLRLLGSSAREKILYSADFDCNEVVLVKPSVVGQFQRMAKKLEKHPHTYISDFKAGAVPKYEVLGGELKGDKLVGFDKEQSLAVFRSLKGLIEPADYAEGLALLEGLQTPAEWLTAKAFFKFHVVHWSVAELLAGKKTHLGEPITLADALEMKSPVKVDVITLLFNNRFVEFSCIYFMKKGRRFINEPGPIENLEYDAMFYLETKNYFKYLKRVYSLSEIHKNAELSAQLEEFFNSKNGMLYIFTASLEVLIHMYENLKNIPAKKVSYELDVFRTFISKYGKEEFADQLRELQSGINVSKLSKLHKDAYDLLQVRSKGFLHSIEEK